MKPPSSASWISRRGWLAATAGASGLGLGLGWWMRPSTAPQATDNAPAALWALRLEQPSGGELALSGLRGKPLLINFWATWCAPCLRELPEVERFHREFGPHGWQVLGLAIDGPTPVREFLARVHVSFPIGLAGMQGTELLRDLGNGQGGLPFSVMIDARGRLTRRKMGETNFAELSRWALQT